MKLLKVLLSSGLIPVISLGDCSLLYSEIDKKTKENESAEGIFEITATSLFIGMTNTIQDN